MMPSVFVLLIVPAGELSTHKVTHVNARPDKLSMSEAFVPSLSSTVPMIESLMSMAMPANVPMARSSLIINVCHAPGITSLMTI